MTIHPRRCCRSQPSPLGVLNALLKHPPHPRGAGVAEGDLAMRMPQGTRRVRRRRAFGGGIDLRVNGRSASMAAGERKLLTALMPGPRRAWRG